MLKALIPMLIFFVIGVGFITVTVLAARLLAPFRPSKVKASAYECGEQVFGEPWIRVHIRFYIFALLFLIFDIETVFLFPWACFLPPTRCFWPGRDAYFYSNPAFRSSLSLAKRDLALDLLTPSELTIG